MISEKEMKIVNAVNFLKANNDKWGATISSLSEGEFDFGRSVTEFTVCMIDEYINCIREMSAGNFIPACELTEDQAKRLHASIDEQSGFHRGSKFEYGQRVYFKDGSHKDKEFNFGCYHPDGVNCLLTFGGGYASASTNSISSKPFKSKEDIELEVAKKKQVDDILLGFNEANILKITKPLARDMLKTMQDFGQAFVIK